MHALLVLAGRHLPRRQHPLRPGTRLGTESRPRPPTGDLTQRSGLAKLRESVHTPSTSAGILYRGGILMMNSTKSASAFPAGIRAWKFSNSCQRRRPFAPCGKRGRRGWLPRRAVGGGRRHRGQCVDLRRSGFFLGPGFRRRNRRCRLENTAAFPTGQGSGASVIPVMTISPRTRRWLDWTGG